MGFSSPRVPTKYASTYPPELTDIAPPKRWWVGKLVFGARPISTGKLLASGRVTKSLNQQKLISWKCSSHEGEKYKCIIKIRDGTLELFNFSMFLVTDPRFKRICTLLLPPNWLSLPTLATSPEWIKISWSGMGLQYKANGLETHAWHHSFFFRRFWENIQNQVSTHFLLTLTTNP